MPLGQAVFQRRRAAIRVIIGAVGNASSNRSGSFGQAHLSPPPRDAHNAQPVRLGGSGQTIDPTWAGCKRADDKLFTLLWATIFHSNLLPSA